MAQAIVTKLPKSANIIGNKFQASCMCTIGMDKHDISWKMTHFHFSDILKLDDYASRLGEIFSFLPMFEV